MKHYTMVFNTSTGSRRSIRVNNPNDDIETAKLSAAVNTMIENDIFDPEPRGSLESLGRMELTVIERTVIF